MKHHFFLSHGEEIRTRWANCCFQKESLIFRIWFPGVTWVNDVFSFSKDEMRRDSLEYAGLKLQVWSQKILLITDEIIYEVWDCILQEPVVRHTALILEKCLLRASSLGDKQREIPRKEEHELNRETKRQTEAVWGHEHPGSQYVLVNLWAMRQRLREELRLIPKLQWLQELKKEKEKKWKARDLQYEIFRSRLNKSTRQKPTTWLCLYVHYWINNVFPANWTVTWYAEKNRQEKYNKTILSTVGKCRLVIRNLQSRDVTFWVHESCWHRAVSSPAVQEEARMWLQQNTGIPSA